MQPRSWIAELVMLRAGGRLPPYFWRDTKWKWKYTHEVKAASKFIKAYGESTVVKIVIANKKLTTLTSYGELEYLLQNEADRLRRLALPKDTSPLRDEVCVKGEDLRTPRPFVRKLTLLEKLDELKQNMTEDHV